MFSVAVMLLLPAQQVPIVSVRTFTPELKLRAYSVLGRAEHGPFTQGQACELLLRELPFQNAREAEQLLRVLRWHLARPEEIH
jgi:hypothetical protein